VLDQGTKQLAKKRGLENVSGWPCLVKKGGAHPTKKKKRKKYICTKNHGLHILGPRQNPFLLKTNV